MTLKGITVKAAGAASRTYLETGGRVCKLLTRDCDFIAVVEQQTWVSREFVGLLLNKRKAAFEKGPTTKTSRYIYLLVDFMESC